MGEVEGFAAERPWLLVFEIIARQATALGKGAILGVANGERPRGVLQVLGRIRRQVKPARE